MKNILNFSHKNSVIDRINKIDPSDKGLWGKMNVNGMVCHLADQIRMAMGELDTQYVGNRTTKYILKPLVLLGVPTPKGKVKTVRELDQNKDGTKPTTLSADKASLINLINRFESAFPEFKTNYRHPAFGQMNKKEWGRLVYIHLDYHLRQFNR
jgi:hypothetical protein